MQCCVDENLTDQADALMQRLRACRLSVVTAESCTGGLVAACLSHGKEASSCFQGGFVVYTQQTVIKTLDLLEQAAAASS